jgi:hypothetical protein
MINAHDVEQLEDALEAPHPPGEAGLRMSGPAVLRVPPMLSVPAEAIRRVAGHAPGLSAPVELEKLRVTPHVSAVVRHENGKVANQSYAQAMGVLAQCPPLAVKLELHETMAGDFIAEPFARRAQR